MRQRKGRRRSVERPPARLLLPGGVRSLSLRIGRRPLTLVGAMGLAVTNLLLGFSYRFGLRGWPVLALVVVAVACYSFSLAPIAWVILSEIFPNRIRGAAMAVGVFSLWAGCFVLTYTFPFLNSNFGPGVPFWLYCAVCITGFLVLWRKLPETRGKTLEQIERELVC
jgi:MFS family permease